MRTFTDNFEPIEIEIVDKNGDKKVIKTKFMTSSQAREIENLRRDRKQNQVDIIYSIMGLMFDMDQKDCEKYSLQLLSEIIIWTSEEVLKKK